MCDITCDIIAQGGEGRKEHSMPSCEKLLERARNSPKNLRFADLCQLAECYGFVFVRQSGSHRIYKRSQWPKIMNFQDRDGKAMPYQVRELLQAIDAIGDEEESDA